MRRKKIFISYSQDSKGHCVKVLQLAGRLRADGLDCVIDQYEASPPEGWLLWMERQIEESEFVLIVFTDNYLARITDQSAAPPGTGVRFESVVIMQDLYDLKMINTKYVPVVFGESDKQHVARPLRSQTCYSIESEYEALYRRLTDQPKIEKTVLGPPKVLPPLELFQNTRSAAPEPSYPDESVRALSQELERCYQRQESLKSMGENITAVREEILDIRRRIREGGQLKPGDFLLDGRFMLLEPIGQGGFAKVWRAFDREEHTIVAVKVLHGQFSEDRTRRERFIRGARRMSRLQHQGIVRVVERPREEGGYFFFVMDYVEGGDLREAVLGGRLSAEEKLRIIIKAGKALHFAHSQGVIHRDIKPGNILLDRVKQPRITDFDLVRAVDTTGGTRSGMLGTVIYTAPEAMEMAKGADVSADVYSLCMTTVFALYGEDLPLATLRNSEHMIDRLDIPEGCYSILKSGVSWIEEERPHSVEEFCDALAAGFQGTHASRSPLSGVGEKSEQTQTKRLFISEEVARFKMLGTSEISSALDRVESDDWVASSGADIGKIRFISEDKDFEIALPRSPEITIGRLDPVNSIYPDVDLTRVDSQVLTSRRHARILCRSDGIFVEDDESTNGTYVYGERISPGIPVEIRNNAEVKFGAVGFLVVFDKSHLGD